MGKIQIPAKLRVEDFDSEDKELIEKIGGIYNSFIDDIYRLVDGGLDSYNINRQIGDVDVKIDSSGKVMGTPQIKITVNGRIRGINVINAVNQVNSGIYPLSAPYVSFSATSTTLTITNISGLQPNSQYRLTLEMIV